VCSRFLFLSRAVDVTLLCPISAIASQSATPTEDALQQTKQLIDYLVTQEEAVLTYNVSNITYLIYKINVKYQFADLEPLTRAPQPTARLLPDEYRMGLRATDRLLASSSGVTKLSQKAPNLQPRALSTGSVVFVFCVLPTNHGLTWLIAHTNNHRSRCYRNYHSSQHKEIARSILHLNQIVHVSGSIDSKMNEWKDED